MNAIIFSWKHFAESCHQHHKLYGYTIGDKILSWWAVHATWSMGCQMISGWEDLNLSYNPAKFGGHRLCGIIGTTSLVCEVIFMARFMWFGGWEVLTLSHHAS